MKWKLLELGVLFGAWIWGYVSGYEEGRKYGIQQARDALKRRRGLK